MKINKYIKVFLLAVILLAITSVLVSADTGYDNVTILVDHLSNDGLLNDGAKIVVNVSVRAPAERNYTEIIAYIQGLGQTANTTLFLINGTGLVKNVTSSNSGVTYNISISINSTKFQDGSDYNLTINFWNGTKRFNESRLVTMDNTIPNAPTSLLPISDTDGTVNFSATIVDENTTRCYLNFTGTNPGKTSYLMSNGTVDCSYNLASVPEQSYIWYVTASDGTNSTSSSTQTTNVDVKTSAGKAALLIAEGKAKSEGGALLSITEGGVLESVSPIIWIIIAITGMIVIFIIAKRKR